MNLVRQVTGGLSRWLDCVADAIFAMIGQASAPRTVHLAERSDEDVAVGAADDPSQGQACDLLIRDRDGLRPLPAGQQRPLQRLRAEILLQPGHFVVRPLELPRRATDFLEGIIRAQIDRLTPWRAEDAVFGWTAPVEIPNDRIVVNVIATARRQVMSFVDTASNLGASHVVVTVLPEGPNPVPVKIFEQSAGSETFRRRIRMAVSVILIVSALAAGVTWGVASIVNSDLDDRTADLTRRIAERRTALRSGGEAAPDSAMAKLKRRKYEVPSSVIALEALSQILPDHTHVTELRIEGNRLQILGITRDAPSLIRLIEQSRHFANATFFAPTTRSPSDPGERFHIEARIQPVFASRT